MTITCRSLLPSAALLLAALLLTACPLPCAAQHAESGFTSTDPEQDDGDSPHSTWSPWTEAGADEDERGRGDDQDRSESSGRRKGEQLGGQPGGPARGKTNLPQPLGMYAKPLNPAQLQYLFDEWLGLDVSKWSNKPRAPEIPWPSSSRRSAHWGR